MIAMAPRFMMLGSRSRVTRIDVGQIMDLVDARRRGVLLGDDTAADVFRVAHPYGAAILRDFGGGGLVAPIEQLESKATGKPIAPSSSPSTSGAPSSTSSTQGAKSSPSSTGKGAAEKGGTNWTLVAAVGAAAVGLLLLLRKVLG